MQGEDRACCGVGGGWWWVQKGPGGQALWEDTARSTGCAGGGGGARTRWDLRGSLLWPRSGLGPWGQGREAVRRVWPVLGDQ